MKLSQNQLLRKYFCLTEQIIKAKYFLNGSQMTVIVEKVHKPPLGVNVINFELNGFLGVPQTPKSYNALIEVFKFM